MLQATEVDYYREITDTEREKKIHRYVNNARYFLLSICQGNSCLACTEIGNSENII
jgi:hypothetical protein